MSVLTRAQIDLLLGQRSITELPPWNSNDEAAVDAFYREACAALMCETGTQSRIEWDHYGSGYASFVDAWFYRPEPAFKSRIPFTYTHGHTGLIVLLSRLSPYFVMMEGDKGWGERNAASYLPDAREADRLHTAAVRELAARMQPLLEARGLVRLRGADLAQPLPAGLAVPTILGDPPYTVFDALFYWED